MTLSSAQLPKVLLVEDAQDNAFVLQHVLGTEFDVQVAHDAQEAFALARGGASAGGARPTRSGLKTSLHRFASAN